MGVGQSCQNLQLTPNGICNIGYCTRELRGKPATTASPTDVWLVCLQDGTKYGDLTPTNNQLVLKVFVDPASNLPMGLGSGSQEMVYESSIYEHVIGPMFEYKINPHFTQFYGRALGCSFRQIRGILEGHARYNYQTPMTGIQANDALIRNTWYFANRVPKRPSIEDPPIMEGQPFIVYDWNGPLNLLYRMNEHRHSILYGMIGTAVSSGVTLGDWFPQHVLPSGEFDHHAWVVITQIISGLTALAPFKCAHNDMHSGNIFIDTLPGGPTVRTYVFFDEKQQVEKSYQTQSNLNAAIYDWDRSYVEQLGNNPFIVANPSFCPDYTECNEYIPQRDLTKFFVYLLQQQINNGIRDILLTLLFSPNDAQARTHFETHVLSGPNPPYLIDNVTKQTMDTNALSHIRHPSRVLNNIIHTLNGGNPYISTMQDTSAVDFTNADTWNFSAPRVLSVLSGGSG